MRSRDGNHSFTRRLCTVIFLSSSLALNAGEYLVSYKYIVKDAMLYNESLDISKSMTQCEGEPSQRLILPSSNAENFPKLVAKHREEFIEYIHTLGLDIQSRDTTTNNQMNSTTIVTLKTTCFKVDFNDTFVKISHLKQPRD